MFSCPFESRLRSSRASFQTSVVCRHNRGAVPERSPQRELWVPRAPNQQAPAEATDSTGFCRPIRGSFISKTRPHGSRRGLLSAAPPALNTRSLIGGAAFQPPSPGDWKVAAPGTLIASACHPTSWTAPAGRRFGFTAKSFQRTINNRRGAKAASCRRTPKPRSGART